jgi:hypothetical protein
MCIVCKCDEAGFKFLGHFNEAQKHMQAAADAMLECSKIDKSYDAAHKAIVRLSREWNKIEHMREKS